ncbi:MAG: hypothetical protein NZ585_15200, partial [Chloracidobacterium sp.]|nr:hypothetical protein [Chloracidobacterium sp.]
LCPVPFYEAQKAFAEKKVWILTLFTKRGSGAAWREATGREICAGDTVMVDREVGCYREEVGWTASPSDRPNTIIDRWENNGHQLVRAWVCVDGSQQPVEIDQRVVGPRARIEDHRCFTRQWMELNEHLCAAEEKAINLANALGLGNDDPIRRSLVLAARWHDVGKALTR